MHARLQEAELVEAQSSESIVLEEILPSPLSLLLVGVLALRNHLPLAHHAEAVLTAPSRSP